MIPANDFFAIAIQARFTAFGIVMVAAGIAVVYSLYHIVKFLLKKI